MSFSLKTKDDVSARQIKALRSGLDLVRNEWLVSDKKVTMHSVRTLHEKVCTGRHEIPYTQTQQLLEYLDIKKENPFIEAALSLVTISEIWAQEICAAYMAHFLSLIFLYRAGYDFRELLVIEDFFTQQKEMYRRKLAEARQGMELTSFIEFYAQGAVQLLEQVKEHIRQGEFQVEIQAKFWELNERQKEILTLLDNPDATVTNRQVVKMFRVSQITAARDLGKLANAGFLFTHGKGRSTYYTKS